jgi:hypothetical protein
MKTFFITLLLLIISACTSEIQKTPQGPAGSWWLGGADGGVFVDIKNDNNKNDRKYYGTIYYDADQAIWYQGPFQLIGNLEFNVDDHQQYIGWDGEKLHLKASSYLEPLNPIPPL